jgi:hypothetical protein
MDEEKGGKHMRTHHLRLTKSQAGVVDIVARRHRCHPLSVAMLAASYGPWKGCVEGLTTFIPKKGKSQKFGSYSLV